ncbi:hypothetical protein N665_0162s0068 [Sinapis alba]|nr:hypothetical protein N665_0162s0068 [Sinapis alba]
MTKYVSVHFKFKGRMCSVTLKTTMEDISLEMIEERLYKKLELDESKVKLALRYMSMVDMFVYLTSIDKENHICLLLVEETSRSVQLEKLSRVGISLFGRNYGVLQVNDNEIRPNAISMYVEDGQTNQQKKLIEAENDDDTT